MRMITLFALLACVFGCDTDNPICTDSFCLLPRGDVTGEVIEIDENKVLLLIGKTSAPIAQGETIGDIIADVAQGGTQYIGQTVTIQATVRFKLESGTLSLFTGTDQVFFFITDRDNTGDLENYNEQSTYTFTIYIRSISPPDEVFDNYSVFSTLAE